MERNIVQRLPFYTQRMTEDNWRQEGFPSLAEAESWTMRGCGIASLRMVLEGLGCSCGGQGDMIARGLAAGAYKEGVGWIHWGLAHMAKDYGIFAEARRGQRPEDIQDALEQGFLCIVSVTPFFQYGKERPEGGIYGKGGHLIPVYGYGEDPGGRKTFLLHHPSAFPEKNKADWEVSWEDFAPSFSGNMIVFRKEGRLRQATAADAFTISRIYAQSWKTAFRGQVPDGYLDALPEEHWVPFFEKALTEGSLSAKLIFDGDTAIGAAAYGPARTELPAGGKMAAKAGDYSGFGEIVSLYLLPAYYRKGYGRELLESVRDALLEHYEGVYLWVLRENARARAFYEKLGFVATEDACLCEIDGKTLTDIRYVYHK